MSDIESSVDARVNVSDAPAILRQTRLWGDSPDDAVQAVAERVRLVRFAAGDALIRQGEIGRRLLVVARGTVEVRVRSTEGASAVVATLRAGECVGEMSLLTGEPASADVVAAAGDAYALELPAEDFADVADANPALLRQLVRILSQRLTSTNAVVGVAQEKEAALAKMLRAQRESDTDLVGKSPEFRKVRDRIAALAPGDNPLLVCGEQGTGKELVARMVHRQSARRAGPVFAVDCVDIADSEWGDRLFGPRGELAGRCPPYFLALAVGGTLVIRNLEHLPPTVQARLVTFLATRGGSTLHDVRIIATMCEPPEAAAAEGVLAPALAAAFADGRIDVPALRDRKRDIPELAAHFLRKHATRLGKSVHGFSDQATTRLVSYDYRIANARELEQAVERAVTLAEGETVAAEEVFLGPPPPARRRGFNLLGLPGIDLRRITPHLPRVGRAVLALGFVGFLGAVFFGPRGADGHAATTLVWAVGWPLLALSFFFVGRACCAVCPIGFASEIASRVGAARRQIPGWIKDHDVSIAMVGLLAIVLAEETTGMRHSPALTAALFLTLLTGAVVAGVLYPRRTWCRHLCPLGGLAGVCATASVLELRPSFDVCSAKCRGHACFKGDEHTAGCPMFNHVMFVDTNRHCVLCMKCVQTCPNESPQLNLRLPGRELWTDGAAGPHLGRFVLMLLGLLVAMAIVQRAASTSGDWHLPTTGPLWAGLVTACLVTGAALPLLTTWPWRRALERSDTDALARFWRRVTAMAPLATAGLVAYQLAYVPGFARLSAAVDFETGPIAVERWASLPLLPFARLAVLAGGLLTTAVILWQTEVSGDGTSQPWAVRWKRDTALVAATIGYWAILNALLVV